MQAEVRAVADELAHRLLSADPFQPALITRDYDALLPAVSRVEEDELRTRLSGFSAQAASTCPATSADAITVAAIIDICHREQLRLDLGSGDHTVSPMGYSGPPLLFTRLARTDLPDDQAAEDYLARIRQSGDWVRQVSDRLQHGTAAGRSPVRSLLRETITWADSMLAGGVEAALTKQRTPLSPTATRAWQTDISDSVRTDLVPALQQWRHQLLACEPLSRDDEHVGLWALPSGDQDYRNAIAIHTTLPLDPAQLHQRGVQRVAELTETATSLGRELGLRSEKEVRQAALAAQTELAPQESMRLAQLAIQRAETWLPEAFNPPYPGPCRVEPMPRAMAELGTAPWYVAPRADVGLPGRYLYNDRIAGIGSGWDRENVAFHEAVPGHHFQMAGRILHLHASAIQQLFIPAFHEGWGLYAETLAYEAGLYGDTRSRIGATYAALIRAARLVVDTGIHAFAWSRRQAINYLTAHTPLPERMAQAQIARYVAQPAAALSYAVGHDEILRLRADARTRLGDQFDVRSFHDAVLGRGALALPVLGRSIDIWIENHESNGG